jgi:hypothetical protein
MASIQVPRDIDFVHIGDRAHLAGLGKGARKALGEDLRRLQRREPALQFKPLQGFGKGVGELVRGGTRVVVSLSDDPCSIWIVCVFDKDSSAGAKMKKEHKDLIESRLKGLREKIKARQRKS